MIRYENKQEFHRGKDLWVEVTHQNQHMYIPVEIGGIYDEKVEVCNRIGDGTCFYVNKHDLYERKYV